MKHFGTAKLNNIYLLCEPSIFPNLNEKLPESKSDLIFVGSMRRVHCKRGLAGNKRESDMLKLCQT